MCQPFDRGRNNHENSPSSSSLSPPKLLQPAGRTDESPSKSPAAAKDSVDETGFPLKMICSSFDALTNCGRLGRLRDSDLAKLSFQVQELEHKISEEIKKRGCLIVDGQD